MTEGSETPYTPLVLRTGFMHSYRRTIPLLGLTVILELIFWTLADLWPRSAELAYIRWGVILILALVVPIGVWTVRDIIAGYDDLFYVFDEETEKTLSLYQRIDRPSSENKEEIRSLFKDQASYSKFQDGVRRVVFDKREILFLLFALILTFSVLLVGQIYPKLILEQSISSYPFVILELTNDSLTAILITLTLSVIFVFGLGYLRTISHLGESRNDLGVWNYIRYLRGTPDKESSFMSYWKFHDSISTIGRHFARIAFSIVLLMTLGGLSQVLFGIPGLVIWTLAGSNVLIGVLILVLPLNSLHRVMLEAKTAVMKELEEEYDHLTLRFVSQLSELRHSEKAARRGKEDVELATKITALRGIISEAKLDRVWPIEMPAVLRIMATSMIPVLVALLNVILRALGIVSG